MSWKQWCRRPWTTWTRRANGPPAEPEGAGGLGIGFHHRRQSRPCRKVFAKVRRAAPSDSTVLLTGESPAPAKSWWPGPSTCSAPGRDREFVPVDCSALVESLLESELFGHVKGSFTGAHLTKHGLFELANHGTFFFDEISNLSHNIQAKLLRVIQEREFMQVGSQKRIKLDIRIIASSNRDLSEAIKSGHFSGGPFLPPQRHPHPSAAFAGAHRRHSAPGGAFSAQV